MNRLSLIPVSALLLAGLAALANAQQPPGRPAAQPTPTPAATAPAASATAPVQLPMSKMAVIYTDLFLDQKTGIAKFNSVVTKLNGEFQKTKDELTQMQTRATTLYPFVPSGPHFAGSVEFFLALGFEKEWEGGGLAGLRFGGAYFLLQDIDVPQ